LHYYYKKIIKIAERWAPLLDLYWSSAAGSFTLKFWG